VAFANGTLYIIMGNTHRFGGTMQIVRIVLAVSFVGVIFSMTRCGEVQHHEQIMNLVELHWDQTSEDYSKYRPGYPDDYFLLLQKLDIGLKNQDILDLGTGTGALALPFARQGAHVTGVDISKGQIDATKALASQRKLKIRFIVTKAEDTNLFNGSFDVITASMCWGYLDQKKMPEEAARLFRKNGLLLIISLNWERDGDTIAKRTGELLNKGNLYKLTAPMN